MNDPVGERNDSTAARSGSASRRARGFTFVEILVVMSIIAVLVGIGVAAYGLVFAKSNVHKTSSQLARMRGVVDAFYRQYHVYPPGDLSRIGGATNVPVKVKGKLNTENAGIESLFQSLHIPGFDTSADFKETELANTDDDRLDAPFASTGNPALFEIKDAWGNPFVYFHNADYAAAEKDPPVYLPGEDSNEQDARLPKPWRVQQGGFANPSSYQLFSMGPDGLPNTDDDLKSWEN